jgi:hypothetical protein
MKYYKNNKTDEIVYEDSCIDYALDKLGIKVSPIGKYGEYTLEQMNFAMIFADWYFQDGWEFCVEKEEK